MKHDTVYEKGLNRMVHTPTSKKGGRFGGENEQRTGRAGRGGMQKSAPRLTISDYDKAKV